MVVLLAETDVASDFNQSINQISIALISRQSQAQWSDSQISVQTLNLSFTFTVYMHIICS